MNEQQQSHLQKLSQGENVIVGDNSSNETKEENSISKKDVVMKKNHEVKVSDTERISTRRSTRNDKKL